MKQKSTGMRWGAVVDLWVAQVICSIEGVAAEKTSPLPSQLTGLPAVFVRKKAKEHGTCKPAEGQGVAGKRIVVVEDVVTSGGQTVESTKELRVLGAIVEDAICVIDRASDASENLRKQGLRLRAIFTMSDLKRSAEPSRAADRDDSPLTQGVRRHE